MSAPKDEFGDLRRHTMRPIVFRVLRRLLLGFCRVALKMDVRNDENVPRDGGCIIVANHLHNLDPVLVAIATPRPLHYMAKKELFDVPVIRRIIRWAGAFPINRGKMDRVALKRAHATLKQGIALGMFPEGTRSVSMKIERVLPGAGLLALQDKVPIVPVAVTGTERMPFNGKKQQRRGSSMPDPGHKGVRIQFGEPFFIPDEIDGKRTNAAAAIDYMMQRVATSLPPDYRGIYGDIRSQVINVPDG